MFPIRITITIIQFPIRIKITIMQYSLESLCYKTIVRVSSTFDFISSTASRKGN